MYTYNTYIYRDMQEIFGFWENYDIEIVFQQCYLFIHYFFPEFFKEKECPIDIVELSARITATRREWDCSALILWVPSKEYVKNLGTGTSDDVFKGLYEKEEVAIKVLKEMNSSPLVPPPWYQGGGQGEG